MKKYKLRILIIAVICIYTALFLIVKQNRIDKTYSDYEYQKKVESIMKNEKGTGIGNEQTEGDPKDGIFIEQKNLLLDIMTTDEMFAVADKMTEGIEFINTVQDFGEDEYQISKDKIKSLFNIDSSEQYMLFLTKIKELKQDNMDIQKAIITGISENENIELELKTSSSEVNFSINVVFDNTDLKNSILSWK